MNVDNYAIALREVADLLRKRFPEESIESIRGVLFTLSTSLDIALKTCVQINFMTNADVREFLDNMKENYED